MSASSEALPKSNPVIRFQGVSRMYGSQRALHEVSFEVREAECFGLVGGNGAGKTTLLKCLLDFIKPDSGSIEIFAVPSQETRARARLAFLPERFVPPYYLNGRDFLRYMLKLQGAPYQPAHVEAMFTALDLDLVALDKAVRAYSKGMTQKLGLAACFLSGKDLLLLDEPTTGLDPKARALFKQQISATVGQGRSVMLTSHALADVDEMCHRMAVLHRGELRFLGTPRALREQFGSDTLENAYLACIGSPAGAQPSAAGSEAAPPG